MPEYTFTVELTIEAPNLDKARARVTDSRLPGQVGQAVVLTDSGDPGFAEPGEGITEQGVVEEPGDVEGVNEPGAGEGFAEVEPPVSNPVDGEVTSEPKGDVEVF